MSPARLKIQPAWIGGALVVVLIVVAALFFQPSSSTDDSSTPRTRATVTSTVGATSRSPGRPTTGGSVDPITGLRWVELTALPRQAQQTVSLIEAGGPYPYSRDGIVFGNREGLLPGERSGWYHEYTWSRLARVIVVRVGSSPVARRARRSIPAWSSSTATITTTPSPGSGSARPDDRARSR